MSRAYSDLFPPYDWKHRFQIEEARSSILMSALHDAINILRANSHSEEADRLSEALRAAA